MSENPELTILVPSHGRPKNAVQLYESFRETCQLDTKLVIVVDEDDLTLPIYWKMLNGFGQVVTVPKGRRGMVDALQAAYVLLQDQLGFSVGFMGDDHRPRTPGWDAAYVASLRELGTGITYGDDLFQHAAMCTQVAMTSDIPKALGYMTPLGFQHLCVDVVWRDWGIALDRLRYLPDVVVEHMHPLAGKSKNDAGYAAVNNHEIANHDNAYYREYHDSERFDRDVEKLKELL